MAAVLGKKDLTFKADTLEWRREEEKATISFVCCQCETKNVAQLSLPTVFVQPFMTRIGYCEKRKIWAGENVYENWPAM